MSTTYSFRSAATTTVLCLFVISSGLQMGAALYEGFVINPLWSNSLPESVIGWNAIPAYAIQPSKYWAKGSGFYALCTVLMLSAAWFMPRGKRNLALLAGTMGVLIVVSTIVFFVPILANTVYSNGAGQSAEVITQQANLWINWNFARCGAGFIGWVAALSALLLPAVPEKVRSTVNVRADGEFAYIEAR